MGRNLHYIEVDGYSVCPVCGTPAYVLTTESMLDSSALKEYKFVCGGSSLHVGCGDWFNTIEAAGEDWEKRCKGIGQPEYYRPTNLEWARAKLSRISDVELAQFLAEPEKSAEKFMSHLTGSFTTYFSSEEKALTFLDKPHLYECCRKCRKCSSDDHYCVCSELVKARETFK